MKNMKTISVLMMKEFLQWVLESEEYFYDHDVDKLWDAYNIEMKELEPKSNVVVNATVLLSDIEKLEKAIADPKLAFRKKMNENYLMVLKNRK